MSDVMTVEDVKNAMRRWDSMLNRPFPGYVCSGCNQVMPSLMDPSKHLPICAVGQSLRRMVDECSAPSRYQ